MRLNWKQVCEQNGVPYVEKGPSVVRGNVAIKCPFCADDDPSHHMGLSLNESRPSWGCWRNPAHRGNNPMPLLVQLFGNARARQIVQLAGKSFPDEPRPFSLARAAPSLVSTGLRLPSEFKPLAGGHTLSAAPFLRYLHDRGFEDAEGVAERHELHYCLSGDFKHRIIYPVVADDRLVDYVGRSIKSSETLRYRASEARAIKHVVGGLDLLDLEKARKKIQVLFIVEGPFDLMKLDWWLRDEKCAVLCTFGTAVTNDQQILLAHLLRSLPTALRTCIVFDKGAEMQGAAFAASLSELSNRRVLCRTCEADDPGEITRGQAFRLLLTS
jgi:hypothetical protein